jgi:Flp pilus assembly protein TadG
MITLWILGLTISVMFLGGLGVDFWHAIAVRREVSAMADAAASAGANGLDENALRGGRLELDEARARELAVSELREYPGSSRLIAAEITVVGARVNVTLREDVRFSLLGIFMGGDKFIVQARASAEPQELP